MNQVLKAGRIVDNDLLEYRMMGYMGAFAQCKRVHNDMHDKQLLNLQRQDELLKQRAEQSKAYKSKVSEKHSQSISVGN